MPKLILFVLLIFCLFNFEKVYLQEKTGNILPLNAIKAGMKGYGLSVFKGEEISKFDVMIIGILYNAQPGRSIILAKCSSPIIDFANVQQGMSGSPVYINDKIIGAIAYTWSDSVEAIAGIQPIEEMLKIWQRTSTSDTPSKPFNFGNNSILTEITPVPDYCDIHTTYNNIKPVLTPIVISGFHPEAQKILQDIFKKSGLEIQTGGNVDEKIISEKTTLNPGETVGAQIVSGDANITAIGTVTYREGNKVLLFGHPLLKRGAVDIPMTRAFVHWIFASKRLSWKIASATKIIGKITQDRSAGASGVIGEFAKTIPLNISVKDPDGIKKFKYNVVNDGILFANLFGALVANSLFEKTNNLFSGSLKAVFYVKFKDLRSNKEYNIKFNDFQLSTNPVEFAKKINEIIKPVQYILFNWYERVQILLIDTKLEAVPNFNVASIVQLRALQSRAKPGDNVSVLVGFRPFRGALTYKIVSIKIPLNYDEEKFSIYIGSARVESLSHQKEFTSFYSPVSIEHLVNILNRRNNYEDLAVWYDWKVPGIIASGDILFNLPTSKAYTYAPQSEIGTSYPVTFSRKIDYYKTNYLIHGWGKVDIEMNYE